MPQDVFPGIFQLNDVANVFNHKFITLLRYRKVESCKANELKFELKFRLDDLDVDYL